MDKDLWTKICFYQSYKPNIICPTCEKGLLTLSKGDIKCKETQKSILDRDEEHFEYEEIKYSFAAVLYCNNTMCREIVSTVGIGGVETVYGSNDEEGYFEDHVDYFYPKYFSPPLKIIPVKIKYPPSIQQLLIDSFALFFADNSSCANKIRQIVEKLLTIKKIPKLTIKKKFIPLSKRIANFKIKYPSRVSIGDSFLAIKFIGNIGSHSADVSREQILDAYNILQHSLDIYYDNEDKRIAKLAKGIIKKRGKNRRVLKS